MRLLRLAVLPIFLLLTSCSLFSPELSDKIALVSTDLADRLAEVNEAAQTTNGMIVEETTTTTIDLGDGHIVTSTMNTTWIISIDQNYIEMVVRDNQGLYYREYVMLLEDGLYRLSVDHSIVRPEKLQQESVTELLTTIDKRFVPSLEDLWVVRFEQNSDNLYTFETDIEEAAENTGIKETLDEIGLSALYENNVFFTVRFFDNENGFRVSFNVDEIPMIGEDATLSIDSSVAVTYLDITPTDPHQLDLIWQLPKTTDTYLVTADASANNQYYIVGSGLDAYVSVWLEQGFYNISTYSNFGSFEYDVLESPSTPLSNGIISIEEPGDYWIHFHDMSNYDFVLTLSFNQLPIDDLVVITDLPLELHLTGFNEGGADLSSYTFQAPNNAGFLIFEANIQPDDQFYFTTEGNSSFDTCEFSVQSTCMVFIEATEEITFIAGGNYQGPFDFNVHFIEYEPYPSEPEQYWHLHDVTSSHPLILIDDDVAYLRFSIAAATNIEVVLDYLYESQAYRQYSLLDADGNLLIEHFYQTQYLEPGDYILKVWLQDGEGILATIITLETH